MNIDPNKVIDAIEKLAKAADVLLHCPSDDGANGTLAGECLKCAAALQASVQIAGHGPRHIVTAGVN